MVVLTFLLFIVWNREYFEGVVCLFVFGGTETVSETGFDRLTFVSMVINPFYSLYSLFINLILN